MRINRFVLAQINPCVGDLAGNFSKIQDSLSRARSLSADVVVFPEMVVTGYPPEDLLLKPAFLNDAEKTTLRLAAFTKGLLAIVGSVQRGKGRILYNAAFVFENGRIQGVYHKMCLPNYGVFDERRYFTPGQAPLIVRYKRKSIAVSICEDIWLPNGPYAAAIGRTRADYLVNLSASPYEKGKHRQRSGAVGLFVKKFKMPLLYANLIGGQDELVFDGQSFLMDRSGKVCQRAAAFKEDLMSVDLGASVRVAALPAPMPEEEEVYRALVLGVGDYVKKNNFPKVAIGLSGGIDSALVACIAVDALGPHRVTGVTMPSAITSSATRSDAHELARRLGIKMIELPIAPIVRSYTHTLRPFFAGLKSGTAEENIQARIRGTLMMALSNKFGWLVLTTGNKSETATGYCTLYGDMAGGFAVIKDVPKTLVYRLAAWRNRQAGGNVIPKTTISRAPTAELRAHQKDQDTLPPYDALDQFISQYVDLDIEAARAGRAARMKPETIRRVTRMVDGNEYKRRQSPPGIKITSKAFGRDRRMPITNGYRT